MEIGQIDKQQDKLVEMVTNFYMAQKNFHEKTEQDLKCLMIIN